MRNIFLIYSKFLNRKTIHLFGLNFFNDLIIDQKYVQKLNQSFEVLFDSNSMNF
jgi:hypothetical protein